jgi:hypothetical protein
VHRLNGASADDYLHALGALAPIVKGVEPRATIESGDDVAVFYEMTTDVGVAPIAEWHQVRGGKIVGIRAYFDARPFAALMQGQRGPGSRSSFP